MKLVFNLNKSKHIEFLLRVSYSLMASFYLFVKKVEGNGRTTAFERQISASPWHVILCACVCTAASKP